MLGGWRAVLNATSLHVNLTIGKTTPSQSFGFVTHGVSRRRHQLISSGLLVSEKDFVRRTMQQFNTILLYTKRHEESILIEMYFNKSSIYGSISGCSSSECLLLKLIRAPASPVCVWVGSGREGGRGIVCVCSGKERLVSVRESEWDRKLN